MRFGPTNGAPGELRKGRSAGGRPFAWLGSGGAISLSIGHVAWLQSAVTDPVSCATVGQWSPLQRTSDGKLLAPTAQRPEAFGEFSERYERIEILRVVRLEDAANQRPPVI